MTIATVVVVVALIVVGQTAVRVVLPASERPASKELAPGRAG